MNPFDPFNLFHLNGFGVMRNVTIAMPIEAVIRFLPPGLQLGPQRMTPPGTHPVIMGFHNMYGLEPSIPTLLPRYTYCEYSMGIPYCYVSTGQISNYTPGPYFFMPILFVNNPWVAFGARLFWGYNKCPAGFRNDDHHYRVFREDGRPIMALSFEAGESRRPGDYQHFPMQQQAIMQPLISLVPFGYGPWFVVAGFPKKWDVAEVQPVKAELEIYEEFVPGVRPGRYPDSGSFPSIDQAVTGSYVVKAPFQVGSPYPPMPNMPGLPIPQPI